MKCFNHRELDAIAVCKHCGRGVCPTCATEVGTATACKGRCEADVAAINDLMMRGRTAYQKGSATHYKLAVFCGLMGVIMGGFGFMVRSEGSPAWGVFFLFGLVFLLGAGMFTHSARRLQQRD